MDVSIVQYNIAFEATEINLKTLEKLIEQQFDGSDLLVLPEMFNTGFTMNVKTCAESMKGLTVNWMLKKSKELKTTIVGSLIIIENNKVYNRLLLVKPSGEILQYNKRHLFALGGEEKHFSAGNRRLVAEVEKMRVCPLVCYDLRFPVWSRNTENFDTILFLANWPASRADAWNILLKARAVENQCYVIAVNRTGIDSNNLNYIGQSQVIDFKGQEIKNLENRENVICKVSINLQDLQDFRKKYPFLDDRDHFTIND